MKKFITLGLLALAMVVLLFFLRPCQCLNSFYQESSIEGFGSQLASVAKAYTKNKVKYKSSYKALDYPMGDVPLNEGVCTDLVIRSYRELGIDLQQKVNEDMKLHFDEYPKTWNLKEADPNIDHRRVSNLAVFFKRKGKSLSITSNPMDYKAGDIIVWNTSFARKNSEHIGIVSQNRAFWCSKRHKVLHHPWGYPREDDSLFYTKIIGHYRYSE